VLIWRLLELGANRAAMNMAIDEAVLTARTINRVPNTLRLYKWKPSAVSIGKNQNPEVEVQLNNCRRLNVDVVRRISGGGTVYHDEHREVTYSLVAKTDDLGVKDIAAVYARVYDGIRDALRLLGVTGDFSAGDAKNCPNLTVKGKKISGSSQANKRDIVLQHGTLLLDADLEKMFTLLRVPWAKTKAEVVALAEGKITSIRHELGHIVPTHTAASAIAIGFKNALGVQMNVGPLSEFEIDLAAKLCRNKYGSDDWNFQGKSILN
jgi:lipoyltransferase/lipoate-protein ligase